MCWCVLVLACSRDWIRRALILPAASFPEVGGQRKGMWIDSLSSMGMSVRSGYVLESYCPYHGSCLLDLRTFRMSDCCCWATCVVVAFAFFFLSLLFGNISSGQRFHFRCRCNFSFFLNHYFFFFVVCFCCSRCSFNFHRCKFFPEQGQSQCVYYSLQLFLLRLGVASSASTAAPGPGAVGVAASSAF